MALKEILKELDQKPNRQPPMKTKRFERQSFFIKETAKEEPRQTEAWPPKKYRDIKGTGYGTTWKPDKFKKNSEENLTKSLENVNNMINIPQKYQNRVNSQTFTSKSKRSIKANEYSSSDDEQDQQKQLILELKGKQ